MAIVEISASRTGQRIIFLGVLLLALTQQAAAQDNYEAGKKPAQMFATDCGLCHKSPAGLSKAPGLFGLESFLREHYTASREAARAIAGYLKDVDAAQPPARAATKKRGSEPRSKASAKPAAKPDTKPEAKPDTSKSQAGEPKNDSKPAELKTDAKASGDKPTEPKAPESKPAEPAAVAAPAASPPKAD